MAWFRPRLAVVIFKKFQLRGTGSFFIPLPEPQPCLPIINRNILVNLDGWGVIDVSRPFSYDPCGLGEDEPLIIETGQATPTPEQIEAELRRTERARDNALLRQLTRENDPTYVAPQSIPAPLLQKPIPIPREAFTISIVRASTLKVAGTVKELVIEQEAEPTPSKPIIAKPQPVIKEEIKQTQIIPPVVHTPFNVTPPKSVKTTDPGRIAPLKVEISPEPSAPAPPINAPQTVIKPEQPTTKKPPENIRHNKPINRSPKKKRK